MIYICPVCRVKIDIDKANNKMTLLVDNTTFTFPKHPDCELAKAVADIDLSKLSKEVAR